MQIVSSPRCIFFLLFAILTFGLSAQEVGLLFIPSDIKTTITEPTKNSSVDAEAEENSQREVSSEVSQDSVANEDLTQRIVATLRDGVMRNGASLVESGIIITNQQFSKKEVEQLVALRVAQVYYDLAHDNSINFDSDLPNPKSDKNFKKKIVDFRSRFSLEEEEDIKIRWGVADSESSDETKTLSIDTFLPAKEVKESFTLLERGENNFKHQFIHSTLFYVLDDILFVKKRSVNGSIQIILSLVLKLYNFWDLENLKQANQIEITVSGFNANEEEALNQGLASIPSQLIHALSSYVVSSGELAIVELINKGEVVVSCGLNQDIYVGEKLVVVAPIMGRSKKIEMGTKGLLVVYKVEDDYAYCRRLYVKRGEQLQIGDRIKIEKQVGLSTQLYASYLGALNKEADYDSSVLRMSSGVSQLPNNASYFSEMVGLLGIRETVLYGCYVVRPFFGLDLFIDGVAGSGSTQFNPEKLFYLGSLEGEGFLYRKDMLGLLRPYLGFSINWHLNRVILSPELAFGFIFNKRIDFTGDSGSAEGSRSGSDYNPIPGTGFNYFTVSSALTVAVVLNSRVNFICNLGFEKWIGNLVELKGKISSGEKSKDDVPFIEASDFIKFFDWQYIKFGVGFSVSY